jgi:hypothetical protein
MPLAVLADSPCLEGLMIDRGILHVYRLAWETFCKGHNVTETERERRWVVMLESSALVPGRRHDTSLREQMLLHQAEVTSEGNFMERQGALRRPLTFGETVQALREIALEGDIVARKYGESGLLSLSADALRMVGVVR